MFGSHQLEGQVLRTGMNAHTDPFWRSPLGSVSWDLGTRVVKSQALGGIWVGDKQPDPAMGRISILRKTGRVPQGCRCESHISANSDILGRRQDSRGLS